MEQVKRVRTVRIQSTYFLIFAAVILGMLYSLQPIFIWVGKHTPLSHPFTSLSFLVMAALVPVCLMRFSFSQLRQSLVLPDYAIGLFFAYSIARLVWQDEAITHSMVLVCSAAVVYMLARMVGRWQAPVFLGAFMLCCLLLMLATLPEMLAHLRTSGMSERLVLYGEIIASRWPSVMVGAVAVAGLSILPSSGWTRLVLLSVFVGVICWFPIFSGTRSVSLAIIVTAAVGFALCRGELLKRVAILVIVFSVASMALMMLPEKRLEFYKQLYSVMEKMPLGPTETGQYVNTQKPIAESIVIVDDKQVPAGKACRVMGNSIYIRKILLAEGINMFLEHPLFGVGVDHYKYHTCLRNKDEPIPSDPHISILHVAAELGLAGLLLFLAPAAWIVRRQMLMIREDKAILRCVSPYFMIWLFHLIHDQFNTAYFSATTYYLVIGIVVGYLSNYRRPAV